jgi:hypothetical protein
MRMSIRMWSVAGAAVASAFAVTAMGCVGGSEMSVLRGLRRLQNLTDRIGKEPLARFSPSRSSVPAERATQLVGE